MKRAHTALALLAPLVCAACADQDPLAPPLEAEQDHAFAMQEAASYGSSAVSLDFDADLENIREQVLPGFEVVEAAETVNALLTELSLHLAAGAVSEAGQTLEGIRTVMAEGVTNRTDAGYVEVVGWAIEAALAAFEPAQDLVF